MVVRPRDGRTLRLQVEANEIASIEFVSGPAHPAATGGTAFLPTLTSGKTLAGEASGDSGGNGKFQLKITSHDPTMGAIVVPPSGID
jgi:hypothetical protein